MIEYVLAFFIILGILIGTEVGSYIWHRYAAHSPYNIISGIRKTHQIHYEADWTHEAHEDFQWVILLLFVLGLGLIGLWYFMLVDSVYLITLYSLVVLVFVWNWYIHSAYHIPNHWLNRYSWFRRDKRRHLQHHIDPSVNYGIATHFTDIIMGSYSLNNPYSFSDFST